MTTGKVAAIAKSMLGGGVGDAVADYIDEHPDVFKDYAKVDGSYSTLTAGTSEQLVSDKGVTEKTPYLARSTGGGASVGDRLRLQEITGGTVAFNQLVKNGDFADASEWLAYKGTLAVSDNVATYTVSEVGTTSVANRLANSFKDYIVGHKYLFAFDAKSSVAGARAGLSFAGSNDGVFIDLPTAGTWVRGMKIVEESYDDPGSSRLWLRWTNASSTASVDDTMSFRNVMLVDLTAMFGPTIADYLYTLESNNAGAGVAKLKSWGFCTKSYYAYDAGSLLNVKTSAHREIGLNQWDEDWEVGGISAYTGLNTGDTTTIRTKGYIPVIPNATYYIKVGNSENYIIKSRFYDANKNYIGTGTSVNYNSTFTVPDNAYYFRFSPQSSYGTTYLNDICLNLHWDGERDGEYEPHVEYNYPLDSDLELQGIPKLDVSSSLYYDGDSYAPDGTVTRKFGIVNLGELNWSKSTDSEYNVIKFTAANSIKIKAKNVGTYEVPNAACFFIDLLPKARYGSHGIIQHGENGINVSGDGIILVNSDFNEMTAEEVKTALARVQLLYELKNQTTETADPYQEIQACAGDGTEQFTDGRTVPMPVGYTALYMADLRSKLESAPENPSANGDYIVRKTNSGNAYVPLIGELPADPAEDGTYTLKVTVADGVATLSWEADT